MRNANLSQERWAKRIHRSRLLRTLGLPDKLPRDLEGTYHVPVVYRNVIGDESAARNVRIVIVPGKPADVRGTGKHRVWIECEHCGTLVQTGRYHQHYGTARCKSLARS